MFGVYFLTNGFKRSYIGSATSNNARNPVSHRFRQHALKLKSGAKYTKQFAQCHLWAKIEGFPTKNTALSYEWFAKRKRLKVHKERLSLPKIVPHDRLETFFAPLLHEKFRGYRDQLIVYVRDPNQEWSKDISDHYSITVKQLQPPYENGHVQRNSENLSFY